MGTDSSLQCISQRSQWGGESVSPGRGRSGTTERGILGNMVYWGVSVGEGVKCMHSHRLSRGSLVLRGRGRLSLCSQIYKASEPQRLRWPRLPHFLIRPKFFSSISSVGAARSIVNSRHRSRKWIESRVRVLCTHAATPHAYRMHAWKCVIIYSTVLRSRQFSCFNSACDPYTYVLWAWQMHLC